MADVLGRVLYGFLSVYLFNLVAFSEARLPVVLVPGDGGSQFFAKLNKSVSPHYYCWKRDPDVFSLWLNLELLLPFAINCFVQNMKLQYDNTTHKTKNQAGVDIFIPGFGETSTIEWFSPSELSSTSYYSPIVEAMVKWGYKRGQDVRGAPYDFRRAPNEFGEFYKNLTLLVEDTYKKNNQTKVVLIAHSFGNPTLLYFLNHQSQAWKDKFIHSFITLSGVWGGAVKPMRLIASGDNLNIPFVEAINVRESQRSLPSTMFLMPSSKFWQDDEIIVMQPKRNYTVKDYKAFFYDLNLTDAYSIRQDTENLVKDLTPPGVEVHCLHGVGVDTPFQLIYTGGMWPDSQPKVVYGKGDGTVNLRSLYGCLSWKGKQKQTVHHQEFPGVEHTAILKNKDIIAYIKSVVNV